MNRLTPRIGLIISAGLFAVLLFVDSYFFTVGDFPRIVRLLRDLVLALIVLGALPLLLTSQWLTRKNITTVLGHIFLGLISFVLLFAAGEYFKSPVPPESARLLIFASTQSFVSTAVLLIGASLAALAMFALLQSLIFYKSKHATPRNFYALLAMLTIYVAVRVVTVDNNGSLVASHLPGKIIFFLLINLMVVNAFRTDWIHFLNRRQKWLTFWAGGLALAGAIFATIMATDERFFQYSVGTATFVGSSLLFMCIYSGGSVLMLLAYLPAAGILDQRMREMEVLRQLSRSITSVREVPSIAQTITENALAVSGSNAAWLELLEDNGRQLRLASTVNLSKDDCEKIMLNPEKGISGWIIANREPVLINSIAEDARSAYLQRWKKNIGALLGVPLLSKDKVLGLLFSTKPDPWSYDQFDRDLLQAFANQAAVAIDNAHLLSESIEKERLEQEWKIAHDAQAKLLPKCMPELPDAEVDAISISASVVGGDFYDFFEDGRRLDVVIGDVSGKGAQAAFQMAHVKGIIQSHAQMALSPREVLSRANALLYRNLERTSFISLIYAEFDFKKREMICGRAGHCPVILVRGDEKPKYLTPSGIGLGLDAGPIFDRLITEERLALQSGDVFIFYTDGVTEAMNEKASEFDEARLLEIASTAPGRSSREILQAIVDALHSFVGAAKSHDDYTLVVVRVK
jgi:serine phosphatase RsbU (regulator of sigma subunit)